ncbi:MAG: hypothetical protein HY518_04830 [Candidatus Aenigmarchaeota archaeon]|nr:hypothetical protein [Candidatus Aenigmarchaeota archaeon]
MGQREYGFSPESGLVHEGAHGVIELVRQRLGDLFEGDELSIVDESVAQLVGIKYMERFNPVEALRYKTSSMATRRILCTWRHSGLCCTRGTGWKTA